MMVSSTTLVSSFLLDVKNKGEGEGVDVNSSLLDDLGVVSPVQNVAV